MSDNPAFASTPNVGSGLTPATADTSRTAPSNATSIFTAGASGARVEEIVMQGVGATAVGVICVFRYDGASYHLIDEFLMAAVTPSTTVKAHRESRTYNTLILAATEEIRITTQHASNEEKVECTVFGGDF